MYSPSEQLRKSLTVPSACFSLTFQSFCGTHEGGSASAEWVFFCFFFAPHSINT